MDSIESDIESTSGTSRLSRKASCIRSVSATVPYKRKYLFNAPGFNSVTMQPVLTAMSSKFSALLDTIRRLDEEDLQQHGTYFKHFIFTDLRNSATGAKALATYFQASGYPLVLKPTKGTRKSKQGIVPTQKAKLVLDDLTPIQGGSDRVGILMSSPAWKSTLTVEVRKELLRVYNSRPDNIHGEYIRFIILDSKYKEGIDLYDVKYMHLMEPQITDADLKQAVGRATRFCGQKGLNFVPNVGWKLHIYMYESEFANGYPFGAITDDQLFDAHTYMMAHSGLDLGQIQMIRDLTLLSIKSSVDYDLNYKINNFAVQTHIYSITDLEEAIVVEMNPNIQNQTGGQQIVNVYPTVKNISIEKCMKRKNKFFPFTVADLQKAIQKTGISIPKRPSRQWLCNQVTEEMVADMLETQKQRGLSSPIEKNIRTPTPASRIPSIKEDEKERVRTPTPASRIPSIKEEEKERVRTPTPASRIPSIKEDEKERVRTPTTPVYSIVSEALATANTLSPYQDLLFPKPVKKQLTPKELAETPDLGDFFAVHEARQEFEHAVKRMSFEDFQTFVRTKYEDYGWESPILKNSCEEVQRPDKPIQFTKTQEFIQRFMTPISPLKGLLVWHSVGTGKTCTAVATASNTFEKEGYSILWATRTSLTADVWKNVFGAVCSIPLQAYKAEGKEFPEKTAEKRRLLGKQWFDPISYKTLENALVPAEKGRYQGRLNKLGVALRDRNGSEDPLRKTLLIIDEVHKLLDGDLKPAEKAEFDVIRDAIYRSYEVSGDDSVKVLLMTATPITDNPENYLRLLNLMIPSEFDRFPSLDEFRRLYTTEDGTITEEGVREFQTRTRGLISYLNREFDPTAFTQPVFHHVRIPVTGSQTKTDAEILEGCESLVGEVEDVDCDIKQLESELERKLAKLRKNTRLSVVEKRQQIRALRNEWEEKIKDCKFQIKTQKELQAVYDEQVETCIKAEVKTRKKQYSSSQQKAARECLKGEVIGTAPELTTATNLMEYRKTQRRKRKEERVIVVKSPTPTSISSLSLSTPSVKVRTPTPLSPPSIKPKIPTPVSSPSIKPRTPTPPPMTPILPRKIVKPQRRRVTIKRRPIFIESKKNRFTTLRRSPNSISSTRVIHPNAKSNTNSVRTTNAVMLTS